MQDKRITRIDRQLASVVVVITAAAHEAESLLDQRLADDLHEALAAVKRIHNGIGQRGQLYKPL
jgi:hypothetical protein